ncbi:MAG: hypothetical protein H3C43_00990 [Leptonema sp. (in: Bacteria)]|nr:hypothetical protein [Leptonema sp. (in: bacteria)]
MSGQDLPYFKFVQPLIEAGIWAKMSSAARALYPVLLSFSDRYFSPVYPGSNKLLQLTGFKQKSSLRRAREELIQIGLILTTPGTGRVNTVYHFRFDWATPRGSKQRPPEAATEADAGVARGVLPYNQIHISINNNHKFNENIKEESQKTIEFLEQKHGKAAVLQASNELELAGLLVDFDSLQKILSVHSPINTQVNLSNGLKTNQNQSWKEIRKFLSEKISQFSMDQLDKALVTETDELLIFSSSLPVHLKQMLSRIAPQVCFEPEITSLRREVWH